MLLSPSGFPSMAPQWPLVEGRTWPKLPASVSASLLAWGLLPSIGFLTFAVLSLSLSFPTGCSGCGTLMGGGDTVLLASTSGVQFLD